MKKLCWLVGVCSVVFVVMLMAPTSSLAAPSLTIDGTPVTDLQLNGPGCGADTGYNRCYSIPNTNVTTEATRSSTRRIGNWYVGDVTSTNQARVLVNDQNTVGAVDKLKITGITFTPVIAGGDTTVVVSNVYNSTSPQGLPAGTFQWGMSQNGFYDPLGLNTANYNRLQNSASGTFPGQTTVNPMGRLDTGTIINSLAGANKSVTATQNAVAVLSYCNSNGTGRCIPTVTVAYTLTTGDGTDALVLNDSLIEAFGTCRDGDEPPADVPESIAPNQLPVGPVCRALQNQINQVLHNDEIDGLKAAKAAGATPSDNCTTACGTGTIVIVKQLVNTSTFADPPDGTFGFTTTGSDLSAFDITTSAKTGSRTFSNVSTGVAAGSRTIEEITFPPPPFPDTSWRLTNVSCSNTGGVGNGTTWVILGDGDGGFFGVTISNLADNDSLTCTFENGLDATIG